MFLQVKPWTQGPLTVKPKLFYTRLDDMELPPNDPVQNRPFFCTWEKAPQDFVDAPNASLERKRPAQRPEPKVVLAAAPPKAELTATSRAPSPRFTSPDEVKARVSEFHKAAAELLVKRKSKPPDAHEVKPWRKSAKPRLGGACQLSPPPSPTPSQTAADKDFFLLFHRADQLESKSRTPSKTGADPPSTQPKQTRKKRQVRKITGLHRRSASGCGGLRRPPRPWRRPPTPPISFRMWREKFVGTVDCPEKILLFQLVPMETV